MRIRPLIIGVTTALIVSMTPASGTAAAAPDPVQVRPDDLSTGAAPTLAYIDSNDNLVRPGATTVDYPRPISHPLRAHHGYVVELTRPENRFLIRDVYFVPDHGKRRLLWRNSSSAEGQRNQVALYDSIVSGDGRLILLHSRGRGKLIVKRVTDGRTVATHGQTRLRRPLAFDGRRVWLLEGENAFSWERPFFAGSLVRWDIDKNKVTRFLSKARAKAQGFDQVAALSLGTGQVATADGSRQLVRPLPGHSGSRWRTGRNELVESWSPDGRFALSIVVGNGFDIGDHDLPAFADVRIRRARTGALVSEFRGLIVVSYEGPKAPVWERDSRSILMSAFMDINEDHEEDPYGTGHGYVRCKVAQSTCKLVLPRYGKRVPADLVNPFAAPRVR